MPDSEAIEILTKAAAIYAANPSHEPVGKYPKSGTKCASTAVISAVGDRPHAYCLTTRVRDRLNAAAGQWIVEYNAKHTTEEVLAVFEAAGATLPEGTS